MKKKLIMVMAAILAFSQAVVVVAADTAVESKPVPQVTKATPQVPALPETVKSKPDSFPSKQSSADLKSNESSDLASPLTTHITSRSRIRRNPSNNSKAFRILERNEAVKVLSSKKGWVYVESKWQFDSGKTIKGYIWGADIPRDVAEKVGVKFSEVQQEAIARTGQISPKRESSSLSAREVSVKLPEARILIDSKPIEAARTALETQVKIMHAENQKLKADAAKNFGNAKNIQAALANSDSKVKQIEGERQKLSLEIQEVKLQLTAANTELLALRMGGKSKLVTLADSGEAVFFKGIGEARMAAADGKSVIRFPLTASNKADKVLLGAKAEKHMNGAFVYYIMDSVGLVY